MLQAPVLKQGQMQKLSCVNYFFIIMQKKNTHFHKKGFTLGLVLRVKVFETQKINGLFSGIIQVRVVLNMVCLLSTFSKSSLELQVIFRLDSSEDE